MMLTLFRMNKTFDLCALVPRGKRKKKKKKKKKKEIYESVAELSSENRKYSPISVQRKKALPTLLVIYRL